jgi:RNA polymerase sigma-70 factor (sigma-E family)
MTRASGEALREAFLKHQSGLVRMCVLVTGEQDLAEDLVQETFEKAAPAIERLSEEEVRPYLRATAMNLWRNRLRRLAVERRHRMWQGTPSLALPIEERDAVWQAIRRLPPRQRACVVLRYYEDLSELETAGVLRCSVGTIKSQTSRALGRLRRELHDED